MDAPATAADMDMPAGGGGGGGGGAAAGAFLGDFAGDLPARPSHSHYSFQLAL